MRHRLTAFVVLLGLGCGLAAGPHPCQAQHAVRNADHPMAMGMTAREARMPCHAHRAMHDSSPALGLFARDGDCCARHGSLCEHACQTAGVVGIAAPRFAIAPVARLAKPRIDRSHPPFAHAIDHVPLA